MRGSFPNMEYVLSKKKSRKDIKGYWELKNDVEIANVKRRLKRSSFNLIMPVGLFIISFSVLASVLDYRNSKTFWLILICSILFSIITYIAQIAKGRSFVGNPGFRVCSRCFKEDELGLKKCKCGGVFYPPEYFNFIKLEDNTLNDKERS